MPTSFIPKSAAVASAQEATVSRIVGFMQFIATLLFIASVIAAGGVYLYKQSIEKGISQNKIAIEKIKGSYDEGAISAILRTGKRIEQAKSLLQAHLAPTALFDFLEKTTLPGTRFTDFSYATNSSGVIVLGLSGEAVDFASVALLSDAFNASHKLSNVLFSNIDMDATTGHITYVISANIIPSLLSYSSVLAGGVSGQNGSESASVAVSATSSANQ